jgi:hypothetical protein
MTHKRQLFHRIVSSLVIILGLVLLVFMIVVEDEPGALPLGMIITGTIWFTIIHRKNKTSHT